MNEGLSPRVCLTQNIYIFPAPSSIGGWYHNACYYTSILTSAEFDSNLEVLSVHNALRVLLPFSEKWYEVGLSLGLPDDTMNTISVNYRHRPDLALHHIIKIWFYNARNPAWADVIKPIPRLGIKLYQVEEY